MCGIAGIVAADRRPPEPKLLERMAAAQFHRGPDQGGIELMSGAGVAHRRLSIIDPDTGRQPMQTPDGRHTLVYNGEIYNYQALTRELQKGGYGFSGHCDTQTLLRAWQAWGPACVERLDGMFAFAVWDDQSRRLFLARDRLGIKPLFYGFTADGDLVFASELKALLVHPRLAREIDPRALECYLALGYVPDPQCIFKKVYKLPPGHTLTYAQGSGEPVARAYWDVTFSENGGADGQEAAQALRDHLNESVRRRLIADVPLGAFLSGGVDSSAITALMAGLSPDPVNTCAVGFDHSAFDELKYARQVADRYKTRHYEGHVDPSDFDLIGRLSQIYDEPFADSSALPTYRVCELARRQVKVALSGDGGDETFAGYRRYRLHWAESRARGWFPRSVRRPVFGALGRAYPKLDWAPRALRAKTTFQSLALDTAQAYCHSVSVIPEYLRNTLYSERFNSELQGYRADDLFRAHAEQATTDHPLSLAQYLDYKTYLPGDILTKVDRASMAHSLEVRVPFLSHGLVSWAATLPPELKLRRGEGKHVLKQGFSDLLPGDILHRSKMGFSVPLADWFRGPLRETSRRAMTRGALVESGLFRPLALHRLWERHVSGRNDHSAVLWSLLILSQFLEGAADNPVPASQSQPARGPIHSHRLRATGG